VPSQAGVAFANVRVSYDAWKGIEVAARAAAPEEACGLLIGDSANLRVDRAVTTRNVHPGPRESRYLVDAAEYLQAEQAASVRGDAILGFFHSHPRSDPVPSETDRVNALPGLLYLIHGSPPSEPAGLLWAWRLDGARFERVPILGWRREDNADHD
jgi:proteasome lid subunit RPN8/RPN11